MYPASGPPAWLVQIFGHAVPFVVVPLYFAGEQHRYSIIIAVTPCAVIARDG